MNGILSTPNTNFTVRYANNIIKNTAHTGNLSESFTIYPLKKKCTIKNAKKIINKNINHIKKIIEKLYPHETAIKVHIIIRNKTKAKIIKPNFSNFTTTPPLLFIGIYYHEQNVISIAYHFYPTHYNGIKIKD